MLFMTERMPDGPVAWESACRPCEPPDSYRKNLLQRAVCRRFFRYESGGSHGRHALSQATGPSGIRSVMKSILNGLRITPFNAFSRTSRPTEKTRQRHTLYLTVFWFPSMCASEKTVKN